MIPFYRFLEVGAFSMLNMMPFLLLAMYPFRRRLRFDKTTTRILVAMMAAIQIGLGCLAAFSPVGSETMSLLSTMIYASFYFFVVKDHLGRLGFVLLLFSNLGTLVSVCAKCMEGNDASMRVMQKLGMSFEGIYKNGMFIKGAYKTIIVYNITREKYEGTV